MRMSEQIKNKNAGRKKEVEIMGWFYIYCYNCQHYIPFSDIKIPQGWVKCPNCKGWVYT